MILQASKDETERSALVQTATQLWSNDFFLPSTHALKSLGVEPCFRAALQGLMSPKIDVLVSEQNVFRVVGERRREWEELKVLAESMKRSNNHHFALTLHSARVSAGLESSDVAAEAPADTPTTRSNNERMTFIVG